METTRKAAAAKGQRHYVSGKPCPQGHTGPRYTLSGQCVQCALNQSKVHQARIRELLESAEQNPSG